MAKSKAGESKAAEASPSQEAVFDGTKLKKLVVKNFRCIGPVGVEVDLDRIVVLVGPNNVGKSNILRAYEIIMTNGKLTETDLPNHKYSVDNPPMIELHTWVDGPGIGENWILTDEQGKKYVRERWTWNESLEGKRQGFDKNLNDFSDSKPIGFDGVAAGRRPKPHRIEAFASPDVQAGQVADLIGGWLREKALESAQSENGGEAALGQLKVAYSSAVDKLKVETKGRKEKAEGTLTSFVGNVFKGYKVTIDVAPNDGDDQLLKSLFLPPILRMGPAGGHMALVKDQGSGAQRTLLWAALRLLAEEAKQKAAKSKKGTSKKTDSASAPTEEPKEDSTKRNNVLLIDEPELCLHPNAIREACKTLYDLANEDTGWQVIVTTHSPIFIDFAREHTTVARVERNAVSGGISGTTIFRPSKASLTSDDQELLKLLNVWDPYVAEFFFGGRTILVEGDTEYSVFKELITRKPDLFPNVHIVRARGKAILVPLIKILNQFGASFSVLHDADDPIVETKNGPQTNGMWTENQKILDAVGAAPTGTSVRLVASIKDFELAVFGKQAKRDKPYSAWKQITGSAGHEKTASDLLNALLDHAKPLPANFLEWKDLEDLQKAVETES